MELQLLESILSLFTGLLGFTVILIILLSMKSNKMVNIYLVLFIAFVSTRFTLISIFHLKMNMDFIQTPSPYKSLFLLSIPCFYLYFKSLLKNNRFFDKQSLYHFILPSLLFFWNLLVINKINSISYLEVTINYFFIVGFVIYYILASFKMLLKKLWLKENINHFQNYYLMRNWTIFLFTVCTFLSARLIASLTYEFIYENALSGWKFSQILASLIWLSIFIKLLISPEILHGLPRLKKIIKIKEAENVTVNGFWKLGSPKIMNSQDLKLKEKMDEKLVQLIRELDKYSRNERIFNNLKLTINDLAIIMKVPSSHLVYLFKYHSNLTFVEFKTLQRIEHSIHLIRNGYLNTNTLDSLASEVGFSSYNPFFSAFKKHTGHSPNDYAMKVLE